MKYFFSLVAIMLLSLGVIAQTTGTIQVKFENAKNCPFYIIKSEIEEYYSDQSKFSNNFKIEIGSLDDNLKSLTISALIFSNNGLLKGMFSKNFKGNFNKNRTYRFIINDNKLEYRQGDKILFFPYYAEMSEKMWFIDENAIFSYLEQGLPLNGVEINESPASSDCKPEQFNSNCNKCESLATNLCTNKGGNVTSFECGCTICKFSCSYGGGTK